jgi:hypothetical protein
MDLNSVPLQYRSLSLSLSLSLSPSLSPHGLVLQLVTFQRFSGITVIFWTFATHTHTLSFPARASSVTSFSYLLPTTLLHDVTFLL